MLSQNKEFHAFELDDELNDDQKNDIRILVSLKNTEEVQEWMEAVGWEDVLYGMTLLEVAALKELDTIVGEMHSYPDAHHFLKRYIQSNAS